MRTPFCAILLLSLCARAAEIELVEAVECRPRVGLANFIAKAQAGNELRIAYLGGSITAQEGWRPKSLAWIQQTYPKAKLTQINAAIGGTGSDLGVFRLKQDVLDQKPDLLFVEFAVNDGGQSPANIWRCMEGIVRQTWRALPECDICFVYTITDTLAPPMYEGKFPRAASAMEKLADRYGIPSIHMAMDVCRQAKNGTLLWKAQFPKTDAEKAAMEGKIAFANDGVHPYPETGHEMYLAAIVRSWQWILKTSREPGPHTLKAPVVEDNYEKAKLIPIDRAKLSAGFVKQDPAKDKIAKQFAKRMPLMYRADKAGESITFKFKGTSAAIYDILAPDAGQVIVTLDDRKPVTISRFDSFTTYPRLGRMTIGADLSDTVHTVKLEISPEAPDKVKILAQRNQTMDDPKRFEGTAWYPGAILVVGELVD
jgi:lysophospholipase L1-like esterase